MPQFRDLLTRLRPAGSPGAASRVGVAVDRVRERSAELEPVVALLAATHAECGRMIAEARREAQQITDEAREQAALAGAQARRDAETARAAAAGEVLAAARYQAAEAARAAAQRTAQPHPGAERAIAELVRTAVDMARDLPGQGRLA